LTGSRLLTSVEIHIITNYLHLDSADYGLQKCLNPPPSLRVGCLTYSQAC